MIDFRRPGTNADQRRESSDPPDAGVDVSDQIRRLERHARTWDAVKKIGMALVFVGGIAVTAVVWGADRASKADVASSEARAIAASNRDAKLEEITKAIVELRTTVTDMKAEDERRWNALDRILDRQFGQTTAATPPPSFGHTARAQGKQ